MDTRILTNRLKIVLRTYGDTLSFLANNDIFIFTVSL